MKKLIALDLDGTLLRSDKSLSERNYNALKRAAEEGHYIVPCTGRFYEGMPDTIKNLPFVQYAITVNGACAERICDHKCLYQAVIDTDRACEIMEYLDSCPVLYDCYSESWGWTHKWMWEKLMQAEYTTGFFHKMVKEYKTPVPDLKEFLKNEKRSVQKISVYTGDSKLKDELMEQLRIQFPEMIITTSLPFNMEINTMEANKGTAVLKLAEVLGIPAEATVAFGDGTNDLTMIRKAGIGVAMANAYDVVKEAADRVTVSCDEDGVAQVLEEILDWK